MLSHLIIKTHMGLITEMNWFWFRLMGFWPRKLKIWSQFQVMNLKINADRVIRRCLINTVPSLTFFPGSFSTAWLFFSGTSVLSSVASSQLGIRKDGQYHLLMWESVVFNSSGILGDWYFQGRNKIRDLRVTSTHSLVF